MPLFCGMAHTVCGQATMESTELLAEPVLFSDPDKEIL